MGCVDENTGYAIVSAREKQDFFLEIRGNFFYNIIRKRWKRC